MANELSYSAAFTFQKGNMKELAESFIGLVSNIAGGVVYHNAPSIGFAAEEALPLGDVTAAKAFFCFYNTDDSNYVEIRSATGASNDILYVPPRGVCMGFFGTDISAPYALANTAAVVLEYWLIPD